MSTGKRLTLTDINKLKTIADEKRYKERGPFTSVGGMYLFPTDEEGYPLGEPRYATPEEEVLLDV